VLWRRSLSAHAGLAADEEALYITDSTDHLWSADPADGAGRWQLEDLAWRRLSGPALVGNALVVGDIDGYVHWVSRRDGRLLGFARVAKARIRATPVVSGNQVFVYADDGSLAAVSAGGAAAAGQTRPARDEAGAAADAEPGASPPSAPARPSRRAPAPAADPVPAAATDDTPRPLPAD
jgi:outer membrane protein assembly factor BamB